MCLRCDSNITTQHHGLSTREDKRKITEGAQESSEKHIAQSHMPKRVKVMSYMNKHTWSNTEAEKKGLEMEERHWDETQKKCESPTGVIVGRSGEQRSKQQQTPRNHNYDR
jgi:hypothetical protein